MQTTGVRIELTRGFTTVVDEADADLSALAWHASCLERPYAARNIYSGGKGTTVYLHKVILERVYGSVSVAGMRGDHINGDRLDNRRSNLRLATHAENTRNALRRRDNTSGYKGVSYSALVGKWRAYVNVDGQQQFLGCFDTAESAHEAYVSAAQQHYGEFVNPGLLATTDMQLAEKKASAR